MLRECANTRIYHLAQCVYPEDGVDMFKAFYAAMLDAACDAFRGASDLVRSDWVALEALRLPVRYGGGDLRSSADVSLVAFRGTVCSVAPTMVTVPAAGTVGFLPQLAAVLGAGPLSLTSPKSQSAKIQPKLNKNSTKIQLHEILRRDGSKFGLTYFTYLEG